MTLPDRMRIRTVGNQIRLIKEHLEAMQRDAHGLEYPRWKSEGDDIWKHIFTEINHMKPTSQRHALDSIKELWTTYITHYNVGLN